ncbi:DUF5719 family protein [Streptomyces gobiensis]|uniref:DUF5719 family protein n=1 Tax=Streptomyces gobiensis TaxID=2875706 RepID=UPI001E3B319F|nr:DUF5719 family protein [Streptomyces gobiensis]UGY91761.1 DUF5719 family protein [Streptomyces gobiensis]
MSLNRTTLALIAVVTALGAITGFATLTAPSTEPTGGAAATAAQLPVERSTLVCPQPSSSELGETTYTAYTPKGEVQRESGNKGSAGLFPAGHTLEGGGRGKHKDNKENEGDEKAPKPELPLKAPGTPVVHETKRTDAPALTGSADGPLAPGWTVQQTTAITAGTGRGMLGVGCSAPDTDFWFAGVSTAEGRHDYIHLTNPDDAPATVDLQLYGKDGKVESESGSGINIPGGATVPVLLSTLTADPVTNVTLHVAVRSGRIGAQVQALDEKLGGDWIAASAAPSGSVVLPGIPADATGVRLVAFAPGERDAELAVKFAGPSGSISPAGRETLHVKSGMATAVDLNDLTKGEPGALLLSPAEGSGQAPVVAGLRVLRGKGAKQEMAFIPATAPVEERTTAAGSSAKGSTLFLVAPGKAAKAKVTASAGSEGGKPVSKTYDLKPGTTTAIDGLRPEGGKGTFALTVEWVSGGPVHAARMLETAKKGIPMFTVQTLPDDGGMVRVPKAAEDLSVLGDG